MLKFPRSLTSTASASGAPSVPVESATLQAKPQGSFVPSGRVKRVGANHIGRDFIVGDIHGAYDLVLIGMKQVGFDTQKDRLFSVGDLIDRGPQSWRAAKFLAQPFVHAVCGNHDMHFAELFAEGMPDKDVLRVLSGMFSMQWVHSTPEHTCLEIARKLSTLPIVMEVETARGMVGIVHGDVPMGMSWPAFVAAIEDGRPEVIATALEGRERLLGNRREGVQDIGRIFVGHTTQRGGPQRYGNVYAVDTGAILSVLTDRDSYALTFANLTCRTTALTEAGRQLPQQVLGIADSDDRGPFSDYFQPPTPQAR